jgi:hypothetical protein
MKNLRTFDQFVNESMINESKQAEKLLVDIFKEAKKSKTFSSVEMTKPRYEGEFFVGDVIYIKSKLKGEDRHKNDYDEFAIGIDEDSGEVVLVYEPSGNETEISTLEEFKNITRA